LPGLLLKHHNTLQHQYTFNVTLQPPCNHLATTNHTFNINTPSASLCNMTTPCPAYYLDVTTPCQIVVG
jgi:hypothetical protein